MSFIHIYLIDNINTKKKTTIFADVSAISLVQLKCIASLSSFKCADSAFLQLELFRLFAVGKSADYGGRL